MWRSLIKLRVAWSRYGWSSLMHAVEAGKNEHVAALLRAGAQKDHRSLQVYGNHPKGSCALDIARRMQAELGVDRKDIIAQLEYEPAKVSPALGLRSARAT